jgi:glucosamine-6-phosphate deaminase
MTAEQKKQPQVNTHFIQLANSEAVGQKAARMVVEQLDAKPDSSFVFPTGKTPLPLYSALRHMPELNWSKSRLFQLDEYVKPSITSPLPYENFAEFMNRELWDYISGKKYYIQHYFSDPLAYEQLVLEDQGPDLVILGIGSNGHVAFNEPGSSKNSVTRVVELAEQTMISNFGVSHKPGYPTQALTLGLKTILSARHIILLATGIGKKAIVQKAFDPYKPPSEACPASWLKLHLNVTVMTDFEV